MEANWTLPGVLDQHPPGTDLEVGTRNIVMYIKYCRYFGKNSNSCIKNNNLYPGDHQYINWRLLMNVYQGLTPTSKHGRHQGTGSSSLQLISRSWWPPICELLFLMPEFELFHSILIYSTIFFVLTSKSVLGGLPVQ